MANISIMSYFEETKSFRVLQSMVSDIIPHRGEMIVLNADSEAVIGKVSEVVYNLSAQCVDIYITEIEPYGRYKLKLDRDP